MINYSNEIKISISKVINVIFKLGQEMNEYTYEQFL